MTELAQKLLEAIRSHPEPSGLGQLEAMRVLNVKEEIAIARAFRELQKEKKIYYDTNGNYKAFPKMEWKPRGFF